MIPDKFPGFWRSYIGILQIPLRRREVPAFLFFLFCFPVFWLVSDELFRRTTLGFMDGSMSREDCQEVRRSLGK